MYFPGILAFEENIRRTYRVYTKNRVKKALIVAENIDFIRRCPSLEYLSVIPALSAENFDFSPLYDMPNIKWLQCETMYGEKENKVSNVDYSRIRGLQRLAVTGAKGHNQVESVKGLKILYFSSGQPVSKTLKGSFDGSLLEELRMVSSNKLPNLNFIYNMPKLKSFIFMMNTENGDLSMCERIPYVAIKNRKHYSHKDKDFSKETAI